MARVLIVGCGCRGRKLAAALRQDGYLVRGTTREGGRRGEIEAAGAEAAVCDPDRLATVMPHLEDVSLVIWLLGSAAGERGALEALHDQRLASLLEKVVDSQVRGFVYEAAGSLPRELLENGSRLVERAAATWSIPVEIVREPPHAPERWLAAQRAAAARLIG